jgi:hypothetical protein
MPSSSAPTPAAEPQAQGGSGSFRWHAVSLGGTSPAASVKETSTFQVSALGQARVEAHDAIKPTVFGSAILEAVAPTSIGILPGMRQTRIGTAMVLAMVFIDTNGQAFPLCRHLKPTWGFAAASQAFGAPKDVTGNATVYARGHALPCPGHCVPSPAVG